MALVRRMNDIEKTYAEMKTKETRDRKALNKRFEAVLKEVDELKNERDQIREWGNQKEI